MTENNESKQGPHNQKCSWLKSVTYFLTTFGVQGWSFQLHTATGSVCDLGQGTESCWDKLPYLFFKQGLQVST